MQIRFSFSSAGIENSEKFPNLSRVAAAMQTNKGSRIALLKAASFCKILGASVAPSLERMRHPLSLILFRTQESFSQTSASWEISTEDGMANGQPQKALGPSCDQNAMESPHDVLPPLSIPTSTPWLFEVTARDPTLGWLPDNGKNAAVCLVTCVILL